MKPSERKTQQCPMCGWYVESIFDHIDIDCDHEMSEAEVQELLDEVEQGEL